MDEAIKAQLQQRLDANQLTTLELGNNNTLYIDPELLESRAPHSSAQVRILSPFDNAVIQRQRGREIFNFDYQIECYVPEPLRKFGYFCLPIQYRDRLVGRMDCKAHRADDALEIRSMHIEQKVDADFTELLAQAIQSFASFNNCAGVLLRPTGSSDLLRNLQAQL